MAIYDTVNGYKYKDKNAKENVINYILNPIKSPSGFVGFMNVDPLNPALSMHNVSASFGKDSGVQIRHFIVSFEKNEISNYATANHIANEIMQHIGSKYPVLYAVHEDTDNIHIHFAFNNVSLEGKRYYGNKADYGWITNRIRTILKHYGVSVLQLKYH